MGTVAMQRGRVPQFPFMKSRTKSPVVFGSTVTGLSSGTGGALTLAHSVVTSLADAGMMPTGATMLRVATTAAIAAVPEIKDDGKFFGAETIKKVNDIIRKIHDEDHKDLLIETYATVPGGAAS